MCCEVVFPGPDRGRNIIDVLAAIDRQGWSSHRKNYKHLYPGGKLLSREEFIRRRDAGTLHEEG